MEKVFSGLNSIKKDCWTVLVSTYHSRDDNTVSRKHFRISGRGCVFEVSAETKREVMIAVARINCAQMGNGITKVYSDIEGDT